jgi:hypothetical protein
MSCELRRERLKVADLAEMIDAAAEARQAGPAQAQHRRMIGAPEPLEKNVLDFPRRRIRNHGRRSQPHAGRRTYLGGLSSP